MAAPSAAEERKTPGEERKLGEEERKEERALTGGAGAQRERKREGERRG